MPELVCRVLITITSCVVIDHDHRAVRHVAHSLMIVLPAPHQREADFFPDPDGRPQGIQQFIEIQHVQAAELGHLAQTLVAGHQPRPQELGNVQETAVDRFIPVHACVLDAHLDVIGGTH